MGCFALGTSGDFQDPTSAVRDGVTGVRGMAEMQRAAARDHSANTLMNLVSDAGFPANKG